jgi:glycosyltransferase involved in cell wall biosynthesis
MSGLVVLQLLPALGDGGVERGTVEMARHLVAMGDEAIVVSAGGPLVSDLESVGARHARMEVGAKSPFAIAANARRLARLIDDEEVDVVHARSRAPAWAGWMAVRRSRRKPVFVTTFHGTYGHGNALKRWYNGIMLKGPLVIANSAFIRDHIRAVYGLPEVRIVVAARGVDLAAFDPSAVDSASIAAIRSEFHVPDGDAMVVLVGRLTRWKGQETLVEAMAKVRAPATVVFVGSGDEDFADELVRRADSLGVAGRIRFAGSRRDIPQVLAAADLAISASIQPEAFGRVAVEAMAMETPVVATDHGGSRETVIPGRTGWLVPPADADALAQAIDDALSDRDRLARMGREGRAHVATRFSAKRTVEAEYDVYRRLLAGRTGAGST